MKLTLFPTLLSRGTCLLALHRESESTHCKGIMRRVELSKLHTVTLSLWQSGTRHSASFNPKPTLVGVQPFHPTV